MAKSVPSVAEHVASLINFLRSKGNLNNGNLKMIGHSLGAHVAGLAAKSVSKAGLVPEIIGKSFFTGRCRRECSSVILHL